MIVDAIKEESFDYEVKNLKSALEGANNALKVESQQKMMDRKTLRSKNQGKSVKR